MLEEELFPGASEIDKDFARALNQLPRIVFAWTEDIKYYLAAEILKEMSQKDSWHEKFKKNRRHCLLGYNSDRRQTSDVYIQKIYHVLYETFLGFEKEKKHPLRKIFKEEGACRAESEQMKNFYQKSQKLDKAIKESKRLLKEYQADQKAQRAYLKARGATLEELKSRMDSMTEELQALKECQNRKEDCDDDHEDDVDFMSLDSEDEVISTDFFGPKNS